MKIKYSDEFMLNHLKELAEKLGRAPYGWEVDNAGKVKYWHYYKRFGLYSAAQKLAGLVPCREIVKKQPYSEYSDEFLINYLKELAVKLGRTPIALDINKAGTLPLNIYPIRFGRFSNAQKLAELVPFSERVRVKQKMYSEYSDEYLLNHLKELAVKLGRAPYGYEIEKAGLVKAWVYTKRFGRLNKAQEAAGLVPFNEIVKQHKYSEYSDEDLLNYLKKLSVKLGKTPSGTDLSKAGKIGIWVYYKRFGSFVKVQKLAGLVPYKERVYKYKYSEYSDEDLLNHLKKLAVKHGRSPYSGEIDEAGMVHSYVYYKRFGSLSAALKVAGLIPTKKPEKYKYTEEDVLNYLKELSVKLGRTPIIKEVIADDKMNLYHICKHFKTYKKALGKAGLVPYKKQCDHLKSYKKQKYYTFKNITKQ
jgi:hypothetical protein